MEETWLESQDWLSVAAFPGFFVVLVEAMMAYELVIRVHSYFLASGHLGIQIYFYMSIYIFMMILIPWSLISGIQRYQAIETRMRNSGADEKDIAFLKRTMRRILASSYMLLSFSIQTILMHLPRP